MHREDETVQAAEASFHRMHHSSSHRVESLAQHMDESPIQSFMNEDVAATYYNALVAYQAPEYRGEPLSMLKDRFWTGWTHSQMIKRHISKCFNT